MLEMKNRVTNNHLAKSTHMRKIALHFLISILAFSCTSAFADDDHSSSSSSSSGGGSSIGIAIGAAAVIGLLIWAVSDRKEEQAPTSEARDPMASQAPIPIEGESDNQRKKVAPASSGGVGNVKSMEF